MRIQHNIPAMSAYRNYSNNTSAVAKNLEKLSSGYKINRAGDDAAGLAVSEKMRAQITGLEVAQKNAKDGISLVQTAEGALTEVHDMLNRMYELAELASNGTYDDEVDRANYQKEIQSLSDEINRIADSVNFNGINLLDGSAGLNKNAFEISDVAAQGAQAVSGIIQTAMPAAGSTVGTNTVLHKDGVTAQAGKFTVDLSQVVADGGTNNAQAKVTINGVDYTVNASTSGKLDGKAIAGLLTTAVNGGNGVKLGASNNTGLGYKATDNGNGTVTFETYWDGNGNALTGGLPTANTADANLKADFTVTVAAGNNTTVTNGENIGTTIQTVPKKDAAGTFGNTFLTLDMSKITDGTVMEIAGEKYTFAIGANSSVDTTQTGVIDLTDFETLATTNATEQDDIMAAITRAAGGNATVTVGHDGTAYGKISLAEKTDGQGASTASADMQEKMSTLDGFKSLVSFTQPAANAATAIQITSSALREGDGLTIGDKRYIFTDDTSKTAPSGVTYVDKNDALNDLKTKLAADGYTAKVNGNKVLVEAAAGEERGPMVLGKGFTLQIGDTADDFNKLTVAVNDMHTAAMGIGSINISTQDGASDAMAKVKAAINYVSSTRGDLGATQNRLEHTISNLSVMQENIQDAESTIRDVDIAKEMMAYTKNNILVQSAQAMLAQANQLPQGVLQLLQ